MNTTAAEYLNKNNQDHRKAFNAYIKDCLTSSRQLELNMDDFIPDHHTKPYKASQKLYRNPLHQIIKDEIDKNKKEYPNAQNAILRLSLLQSFIMSMMVNTSDIEESLRRSMQLSNLSRSQHQFK